ncbi:MAG: cycH [Hyphomicrobiales bacterium]|nr:cycH [Hyphomicrobiales bacterium]
MIWAAFALMTGAVVLAVLWPLGRARGASARTPDVSFYRSQVEEIDRDVQLGLLTAADGEVAKAEAGRRLLRVTDEPVADGKSRMGAKIGAIIALVAIPAVALSVYASIGRPDVPDQPLAARVAERQGQVEVQSAVRKIEEHLATSPDDGRGWEILAPVYMKMGRYDDAARAFGQAARVLGETPERLTAQGEALVYAAQDSVTPQAQDIFAKVLELMPGHPVAFFYMALAREQGGDRDGALEAYTQLAKGTPPNAPWQPVVRARILGLGGTPPAVDDGPKGETADAVRAMPSAEQREMIRGMVDSLAARLDADGSDVEGWLRLLRSYKVLQENDLAKAALTKARTALGADPEGLSRVNALADELGLKS